MSYYLFTVNGNTEHQFVIESNNKKEAQFFAAINVFKLKDAGLFQDFSNVDFLLCPCKKISTSKFKEIERDDDDETVYLGNYVHEVYV